MDRLRAMSAFVAVAEAGGFAAAARKLALSPPSVTRAIAELEAHLGCRLLHRTTRFVGPTEAGLRYLDDCRRILTDVASAERQAAGRHGEPRGRVSVTASVMFGRMVLRPILFGLLDRYPGLELDTLFIDRVAHLVEEGLDVAIRIADLPDSALSAVRVGQVRRVLCAAPGYLDVRGRPEALGDLADHALIDFTNMTRDGEWDLVSARYRPAASFHANAGDVAREAALEGRGITRLLSYMIADDLAAGRLETVLDGMAPPPIPVHVVHKEAGQTSARVRATVDHLVEALRGHPALR